MCEDSNMFIARRIVFALVLAAFRMWRRMPPEDRKRVLDAIRTHGTRAAASLKQRSRG